MTLQSAFIYLLFLSTSLLAVGFCLLKLGLKMAVLGRVLRELSECVGASMVFFALNLAIGVVLVLLTRGAGLFVSFYPLTDVMLVVLSAAQGFVFQLWWRRS